LTQYGELLPLLSDGGAEMWVFNITSVVDALDEERSSLVRFPDQTHRIMKIRTHAFRSDVLNGVGMFKIPQLLRGTVYVNDEVAGAIRDSGLTGLDFQPVWSSP
jgi:hypothetical protein